MWDLILRRFVALIYPLGLVWAVCLVVFFWACWKRRKKLAGFSAGIILVLWAACGSPIPSLLLKSLEEPYYHVELSSLPQCDAIVMLGGVLNGSEYDSFKFTANANFDRAMTAIDLLRQKKAPVLLLGGVQIKSKDEILMEGQLLKNWMEKWRLDFGQIIIFHHSSNTRDEARQTKDLMDKNGWKRVILVTSAYHMQRAEAIFGRLGITTVAAPCDFRTAIPVDAYYWVTIPSYANLEKTEVYLHELIGWYFYKWFGRGG